MRQGNTGETDPRHAPASTDEHLSNERAAYAQLELGDAQRKEGAHTAAIATHTPALESGSLKSLPHYEARTLFSRAEAYRALNKPAPAIADYTAALASGLLPSEHTAWALYGRGTARMFTRTSDAEAIDDLTEALNSKLLPPELVARAHAALSELYRTAGRYDDAIEHHTVALNSPHVPPEMKARLHAERGLAYRLRPSKNESAARADYTTALESGLLSPELGARVLYGRGQSYALAANHRAAIADYTASLELHCLPPALEAEVQADRGMSRMLAANYRAAIADYTVAIESRLLPAERQTRTLGNRAESHRKNGDQPAAIADYTVVLASSPSPKDKARALCGRADSHRLDGNYNAAIADYTAALTRPDVLTAEIAALARLGRAESNRLNGNHLAAIPDCDDALKSGGLSDLHTALARYGRGASHHLTGNLGAAVEDYTAALQSERLPLNLAAAARVCVNKLSGRAGNRGIVATESLAAEESSRLAPKRKAETQAGPAKASRVTVHDSDSDSISTSRGTPPRNSDLSPVRNEAAAALGGDHFQQVADYTATLARDRLVLRAMALARFARGESYELIGNDRAPLTDHIDGSEPQRCAASHGTLLQNSRLPPSRTEASTVLGSAPLQRGRTNVNGAMGPAAASGMSRPPARRPPGEWARGSR
jgi:tetratricopeptide (TPR) repeat protein